MTRFPEVSLAAAAAAWAGSRRVMAGAWNVRFREAGSGPPLVLVHGLGVSADYWFRNGPGLAAAGLRVFAPDLPGFGRTRGPAGALPVRAQAEALLRWADAVGIGPAVYVGHSLGAQAILELAVHHPRSVLGLVLAAPTGAPMRARLAHQMWSLFRDVWREPPELVPPVAQAYLRAGPRRILQTWRTGVRHDPLPLLARVHAPSLVVVGTEDPVVPASYAEMLARGLPGGRTVWISGAAHAAHFSHPARFNQAVTEFAAAPPVPRRAAEPSARGAR